MQISNSPNVVSKKGFTLLELLVVVILILVLYTIITPTLRQKSEPTFRMENLYTLLYPNGTFTIYDTKEAFLKKGDSEKKFSLLFDNIEVYHYNEDRFEPIVPKKEQEKSILFRYEVKKGVGESFIVKLDSLFYVFKPFFIQKCSSFDEAQTIFTHPKLQPYQGEIL